MLPMSLIKSIRFSNKYLFILAILIVLAYLSPYYFLGENTHIRVHDNLDSNIVWYKILAESGQIFAAPNSQLPNIINGLPRSALPSALDGVLWLYVLFPPFLAYAISQTMMRIIAFIGMFLLLRTYIIPGLQRGYYVIALGVSVCFAILPYWPSGVLSIAGLPLATYLFLTIRQREFETPKRYWVYLSLIPFFSNFILTFVFFLTIVGLLFLYDVWKKKRFNRAFFLSISLMISIYLIKNYMLIYSMFIDSGSVSHRKELDLGYNSFTQTVQLFKQNFIHSHTHALDFHATIILPVILVGFVIATFYRTNVNLLIKLFLLNVLFSLAYSFWYWEGLRMLKDSFSVFNEFNFGRFHLLRPFLWYMMFAIALSIIWKKLKFGSIIVCLLLIAQIGQLFVLTEEIKYRHVGTPTYAEFYDEELFAEIETYIDKPQENYRVVSIALHPTIAQYNGFYTLDTYNNTIPLAYKHDFRKIIAPELEKNHTLEKYFDTWGSRLYVFSDEIGKKYVFKKDSDMRINELDLNIEQLKKLGGKYIFSGIPIENHTELGLEFEKSFSTKDSYWKIHLYRVNEKELDHN